MKYLLIAIHPSPSPQAVPLANAFLQAFVTADPVLGPVAEVELCNFYCGDVPEHQVRTILNAGPDAVGFSCYVWNRTECLVLAAALRRERPGLVLFMGGPEATADPEALLQGSSLDFLILGEGEQTFREVVARLETGQSLTGIAGTAWRSGDQVQKLAREPMQSLDLLPSPYLGGLLASDPYPGALWQLSRGCDFACSFCYDQKGLHGVRRFPPERLAAELDWFVRNDIRQIFVLDSTFNRNVKQAKELLRLIGKKAPHIHFHFEVRYEFIDAEMARLFAQLNCSLQIGLQSSDPGVHKAVRRTFNPSDFMTKVSLLNESGAVFGFDLIFGLPGDSLLSFKESLDFALALYPNHLDIFPLAVLPGTDLARRAPQLALHALPNPPYTLLDTPTFPVPDMVEASRLATACDIFYSRGKAVAWFNAIVAPLSMSSSAFLCGFADWLFEQRERELTEVDFSDEEIWQTQRNYLSRLYVGRRLKKLLPAALDLVDYHYHFAAVLLAPQPELPTDRDLERTNLLKVPLVVAPEVRMARFNYEIIDLLEAGDPDLREFTSCFSPSCSWAVMYPRAGEVFTESLVEPYFLLLGRLDGRTPPGEIAATLKIPAAEAASFLEFAAAEGIVRQPA